MTKICAKSIWTVGDRGRITSRLARLKVRGVNAMNATNTHVANVRFEEREIDIGFTMDVLLLVFAYVFEAGVIVYMLVR